MVNIYHPIFSSVPTSSIWFRSEDGGTGIDSLLSYPSSTNTLFLNLHISGINHLIMHALIINNQTKPKTPATISISSLFSEYFSSIWDWWNTSDGRVC